MWLASGWWNTELPVDRVIASGSAKPRTPGRVPKYSSKERFSCIRMTTCSMSDRLPVVCGAAAAAASARVRFGGRASAASAAAPAAPAVPSSRRRVRSVMTVLRGTGRLGVEQCVRAGRGQAADRVRVGRLPLPVQPPGVNSTIWLLPESVTKTSPALLTASAWGELSRPGWAFPNSFR